MEILALVGMPKVVTGSGGLNRMTRAMSASASGASTFAPHSLATPGESFDHDLRAYQSGNIEGGFQLNLPLGLTQAVTDKFNRVVVGFRVVFTSSPGPEVYAQTQVLTLASQIIASAGTQVGSTTSKLPINLNSTLNLAEGQYIEFVIEPATSKFEVYIDGIRVLANTAYAYPIASLTSINFTGFRKGNIRIYGHFRDMYFARVDKDEVFDPLGSLRVQEFPVTSTTSTAVTPNDINTLTTMMSSSQGIVDTVGGVNDIRQGYGDPTVLKSALAITAIAPGISPTGQMVVTSGATEFSTDTGVIYNTGTYPASSVMVDPSKIDADLKVTFKLKPL